MRAVGLVFLAACGARPAARPGLDEPGGDGRWIDAGEADAGVPPGCSGCREGGYVECDGKPVACPPGQVCDPSMGEGCVPMVCSPGNVWCVDDATVVTCSYYGTGMEVVKKCGGGESCWSGVCLSACEIAEEQKSPAGCRYYATRLGVAYDEGGTTLLVVNPSDASTANVSEYGFNFASYEWDEVASVSVPPGSAGTFLDSFFDTELGQASDLAAPGAHRIDSDRPVFIYQFHEYGAARSAATLLPVHLLDRQYYVTTTLGGLYSWVTAVAVEDGTDVALRPAAGVNGGDGVEALEAGDTEFFTLDEGDVLTLASDGDLTGTYVEAAQPIAVFGHTTGAAEQAIPIVRWGQVFAAVPDRGDPEWRILAAEDETTVVLDGWGDDCLLPDVPALASGGWFAFSSGCAVRVEADKPVSLTEILFAPYDVALVAIPLVEALVERTYVPQIGSSDATIVRPTGVAGDLLLDGEPADAAWQPFGGEDLEYARLSLGDGPSTLDLACVTKECGMAVRVTQENAEAVVGYAAPVQYPVIWSGTGAVATWDELSPPPPPDPRASRRVSRGDE